MALGNLSDSFVPRRAITKAAALELDRAYILMYLTNPIKLE